MKELYISPEANLVGFVASTNMAGDLYVEMNPWGGEDAEIAPTGSLTDIEVNLK